MLDFLLKGARYMDQCPVESMTPIYLIVAGAAGLFGNCCNGSVTYQNREKREKKVNPLQIVMMFTLVAWFICGNVWIYENYEPTSPTQAAAAPVTRHCTCLHSGSLRLLHYIWCRVNYYVLDVDLDGLSSLPARIFKILNE